VPLGFVLGKCTVIFKQILTKPKTEITKEGVDITCRADVLPTYVVSVLQVSNIVKKLSAVCSGLNTLVLSNLKVTKYAVVWRKCI